MTFKNLCCLPDLLLREPLLFPSGFGTCRIFSKKILLITGLIVFIPISVMLLPPPPCLETKDESMYNSITLLPDVQLLTWLKYIAEKLTKVQSDHGDYLILKQSFP